MSSMFSGISIAARGLSASQTALNVTSHNLSNATTAGYVRQQAMQSDAAYIAAGQYQIGTGSNIEEIRQIRSLFFDNQYRNANSGLSYWQIRQNTVSDIEAVMDDLSEDGGLQGSIDAFFNSWEQLSQDPSNPEMRASLLAYAGAMTDMFNQLGTQLDQIQEDLDSQITSMVSDINSISGQIAALNAEIARHEVNGDNANDLRDELNVLLDTLSGYVDISVSTSGSGMYNVSIGGAALVSGTSAYTLSSQTNGENGAFNTVTWEGTGAGLILQDGMLLGLINARGDVNGDAGRSDNGSPVESGIEEADVDSDSAAYNFTGDSPNLLPELRAGLNALVSLMARKINAIHRGGEGLDGSTGLDFFVRLDDGLPYQIGNLQVNPALYNTAAIAASSIGGTNDGSVAGAISDFADTAYFNFNGLTVNAGDFYSNLVGWLGTQGDEATSYTDNQNVLLQSIAVRRDSLSAVSMDEELTNLIRYQHAYNACARVMSTMDSMLETIIETMGLVGR